MLYNCLREHVLLLIRRPTILPLVTECHHADIARARYNGPLWFLVEHGISLVHHQLLDLGLPHLNLLTCKLTNNQDLEGGRGGREGRGGRGGGEGGEGGEGGRGGRGGGRGGRGGGRGGRGGGRGGRSRGNYRRIRSTHPYPFIEAFQVGHFFRFLKLQSVVLGGHFHLVTGQYGAEVTQSWDLNDGDLRTAEWEREGAQWTVKSG